MRFYALPSSKSGRFGRERIWTFPIDDGNFIVVLCTLPLTNPHQPPREMEQTLAYIQKLIKSVVNNFDVISCESLDAIVAELLNSNEAITVQVHHFKVGLNESSHSLGKVRGIEINHIIKLRGKLNDSRWILGVDFHRFGSDKFPFWHKILISI